ncbi:Hypothetical protein MVR_LOCUS35 [uncultured virus]|nr:Hypothetical protein MVR_LOCUS35 [uncultured virus]
MPKLMSLKLEGDGYNAIDIQMDTKTNRLDEVSIMGFLHVTVNTTPSVKELVSDLHFVNAGNFESMMCLTAVSEAVLIAMPNVKHIQKRLEDNTCESITPYALFTKLQN